MEPASKRRRLSHNDQSHEHSTKSTGTTLQSLRRSVSPPRMKRSRAEAASSEAPRETAVASSSDAKQDEAAKVFKSPFQLTWIRDLPEAANTDAVTLEDILGDPLIAECWNFNYLHDIDFLMAAFDQDVRQSVQVNVVHGFWKTEDPNRLMLQVSDYLHFGSSGADLHADETDGSQTTQKRQASLRLHA